MPARPLLGPRSAPELHLMTWNIRRTMPHLNPRSPDDWMRRREALRRVLQRELPSVLGVQEAFPAQAAWIADGLGPNYRRIGHGRSADGRGEGSPVFVDTARLRVESWTQRALSDTPHVAGSSSWGNVFPRVAVVALLADRATGTRIRIVNTHFDHLSARSRVRSADAVADLIDEVPTVVMGDFNASAGSPPIERMLRRGLHDAWSQAGTRVSPPWGTFTNYRPPRSGGRRIDWMFVTPGITVAYAGINDCAVEASDHLPVQAVVTLP